jgi:hypothetical protein
MTRKLVHLAGAVTALMFSLTAAAGTTLWHTFATSTGGGTKYRVSTDGNVYSIESPTGYEHINIGSTIEGYLLCYGTTVPASAAWDVANSVDGFATATHTSGSPFTVTRRTSNGSVQLTQVFTFNATSKSLNIVMTVKNLTGSSLNIVLRRIADFDVDVGGTKGFGFFGDNWFATTQDAVFAWNDPGAFLGLSTHGLVLRHLQKASGISSVALIPSENLNCRLEGTFTPVQGDYSGAIHYSFSLAARASKSVTIQYLRD